MTLFPDHEQRAPSDQFSAYQQGYYAPPPPPPRRSRGKVVVSLVVLGAVAAASLAIITNRQYLVDQWTVMNYSPASVIQQYIDRSTMTEHGAFLFKASEPEVASAEVFNSVCSNEEEGSGVLGCYTSDNKRITLFDVTDEQLDGLEEVVASHEMLHAAWDRMSLDEQNEISALLDAEVPALADDPDFVERMDYYARNEPGERENELHSIIGTEVSTLSPALEEYYAKYFADRAALVALHVKSNAVFVSIQAQSEALVAELDALNAQIESDYARYTSGYDDLNADIESYNNTVFTSQEEANRQYNALIARQASLDTLYSQVQAMDATYKQKHAQLEALNAQAAALNTSINIVPHESESAN